MGVLVAGEGPEEDLKKGGGGGRPVVATRESFARGGNGRRRGVPRKGQDGLLLSRNSYGPQGGPGCCFGSDPSSCLGL